MSKGFPKNGINKGWFKKGLIPANKGKKTFKSAICKKCNIKFDYYHSGVRKYCSIKCANMIPFRSKKECKECGKIFLIPRHREKRVKFCSISCLIRHTHKNRKFSEDHKKKISLAHLGLKKPWLGQWNKENPMKGEKNPAWKGGITSENRLLRHSPLYENWRKSVMKRDNWTCQECFVRGGDLEVHHIHLFIKNPTLRFEINNGITLCRECHQLTKGKESLFVSKYLTVLKITQ